MTIRNVVSGYEPQTQWGCDFGIFNTFLTIDMPASHTAVGGAVVDIEVVFQEGLLLRPYAQHLQIDLGLATSPSPVSGLDLDPHLYLNGSNLNRSVPGATIWSSGSGVTGILESGAALVDKEQVGRLDSIQATFVLPADLATQDVTATLDMTALGGCYAPVAGFYPLIAVPFTCPDDDEHEENDALVDATMLTNMLEEPGIVCGDDDWYVIPVLSGFDLFTSLRFEHSRGDLDMQLYHPNGNLLASSRSANDNESIAIRTDADGDYALRVYGANGAQNDYDLVMSAYPAPTCDGQIVTIDMNVDPAAIGTPLADVILGTPGADIIIGLGGDDTVCAGDGPDTVYGGNGDDTIFGGAGDDLVSGQGGVDVLRGGSGEDQIFGGVGNDQIWGGSGNDDLRGQGDNDTMMGEDGVDQFYGGSGDDVIHTGTGGNRGGTQVVRGGPNNDTIYGGPQSDELDGGPGLDELHGGDGDDLLTGGNARDVLFGDAGSDELQGAQSKDFLYGGDDSDTLLGGTGPDELFGESGDDFLDGQGSVGEVDTCDGGTAGQTLGDTAANCELTTNIP